MQDLALPLRRPKTAASRLPGMGAPFAVGDGYEMYTTWRRIGVLVSDRRLAAGETRRIPLFAGHPIRPVFRASIRSGEVLAVDMADGRRLRMSLESLSIWLQAVEATQEMRWVDEAVLERRPDRSALASFREQSIPLQSAMLAWLVEDGDGAVDSQLGKSIRLTWRTHQAVSAWMREAVHTRPLAAMVSAAASDFGAARRIVSS